VLIILNNKTISVEDGGFYSYEVTTPKSLLFWFIIVPDAITILVASQCLSVDELLQSFEARILYISVPFNLKNLKGLLLSFTVNGFQQC
jgi:hypothetical protein